MVVRRRHPRLVVDVGEHLEAKRLILVEKLESARHVVPAIFPNEIGVRQQALEIEAHLLAALGTRVAGEARPAVGDELVKIVRHRLLRHRVSGETCDSIIAHAPDRRSAHRRQCLVKVLPAASTTSHCSCGGGAAVRYGAAAPRPRHDRGHQSDQVEFSMRLSPTLAALALLAAASTPALAQGFPCLDNLSKQPGRTPPPDHYSSATWLQLPPFPDPSILPLIVGTWYTENQSPQTNQIQRIYSVFDANGLYQYRDQTC